MVKTLQYRFQKKEYNVLLIDDHLGNLTSAGFLQYKLNESLKENKIKIEEFYGESEIKIIISSEKSLDNFEYRLKSEPVDLILLDLNFQHVINCLKLKCREIERNSKCYYCEEISNIIKDKVGEHSGITPEDIYKELGAYWLLYKIRPFNPAIPVIIFTSKFENNIEMASKYGLYGYDADYYEKSKLLPDNNSVNVKNAFKSLLYKILNGIKRFENTFQDRIEVSETREEAILHSKNRDYMQTRLWSVLAEWFLREKESKETSNRFAVAFIDLDGMKVVNDKLGITKTNIIIKNFTEMISEFIDKNWKDIVDKDYQWVPFYRPVTGRYFRERGDELLIIFPVIKDKEIDDKSGKKGIIDILEELREEINKREWQTRLFRDDKDCYQEIEEYLNSYNELTISTGLLVFPDDLTIESRRKLDALKDVANNDKNKFISCMTDIYSEIIKVPQILKEKAKLLGKDQICYFQKEHPLDGNEKIFVSPRVNVGIIYSEGLTIEKEGLIEFLKYLTDEIAYDFVIIEDNEIDKLSLENSKYNYHLILYIYKKDDEFIAKLPITLQRIKDNLCGIIVWYYDDKIEDIVAAKGNINRLFKNSSITIRRDMESFPKLCNDGKWILTRYNKGIHNKMIASIGYINQARRSFFEAVSLLAEENRCDEYYPRFSIQAAIHGKFGDLKKDIVILEKAHDNSDGSIGRDAERLGGFYKGLKIRSPQSIWVIKKVSNKGGHNKFNIIVTIEVEEVAFDFLNMKSGRNMMKLQQYFNGFLKGFLGSDPDKYFRTHLIDLKYDVTEGKYTENIREADGAIVCRSPFFSPVSPNVYYEIVKPSRVRIDISFLQ